MENELPILRIEGTLRERTLSDYWDKYAINAPIVGLDISKCEYINSTGHLFLFQSMLKHKRNARKFKAIYTSQNPTQKRFVRSCCRIIDNLEPIDLSVS